MDADTILSTALRANAARAQLASVLEQQGHDAIKCIRNWERAGRLVFINGGASTPEPVKPPAPGMTVEVQRTSKWA